MKHALMGSAALVLSLFASQSRAEPLVVDNGRLFLQIRVNGAATEALLDSGAEATLIDDQFANEVKLPEGSPLTIRGSGGTAPATAVEGVTMEVLGLTVHPEVVVVTDLNDLSARLIQRPTAVILGREFFDATRLVIDISGRQIAVVPKSYTPAGERLQLTDHAGIEAIAARANGVESQAELDFGNGSDVLISRALAKRLKLKVVGRKSGGGIGGKLEQDLVVLDSLAVGGVEFRNVAAAIDDQPTAGDLNIGTAILGRFRVTTDFAAGAIWLKPESGRATDAASASPEHLICEYRTPIGSHLRKRVCRTKEELEAERSAAENSLRTIPKSGSR